MSGTDRTTTADAVRSLILRGDYGQGERLGEVELAKLLGVSRTPIREALRSLSSEGLVDLIPNKGARVVDFTIAELEDIFELRAQVEGTAARLAAARIDETGLEELQCLAADIATHALPGEGQSLDLVYDLNARFHAGVAQAAGSASLQGVIDSLFHTVAVLRTLQGFDDNAVRRSVAHHLELVAAMRARDGRWAESVMRSHLYSARASVLGPRGDTGARPSSAPAPMPDEVGEEQR